MKREIIYTDVFISQLDLLINYLSDFNDEVTVIDRVVEFVERFEKVVELDPLAAPISQSLIELGITRYREFNADGLRLIYSFDREIVNMFLISQQKQDLEKLLVDYCLIYK